MKIIRSLVIVLMSFTYAAGAQASSKNVNNTAVSDVPKPRIIALSPHIVEILFKIGAGDQIIATTDYADYPLAAKKIPKIGSASRIQLERVIELQPDLIIAWRSGNPSDDLARIKQLGFNVVYSQPDSFEDLANEVRSFGKLSGHTEQADRVATKFLTDLDKIKKQYGNKAPLTGFYEVWSRPLTTIAKGSWPQQFLDICSIKNPFYQAQAQYPQVNIEQILQTNIDVIIVPLSTKQANEDAYDWQKWSILKAVKHQQMIKLNADVAHRMTTRSLHALTELCQQAEKSRLYYQQVIGE
ncbi:cobalamin-binding protein [Colwellia sp. BRX10-3]|uniref:cobalamin-binding protein n=1 Tax=Colwellia sp. BRX10-3 TaxID=2759844 RepID=UPI0015F785C9|nr:cobalamin-binding protein [Colwellia sp. BRX10-3]MBA6391698.1 cobalamin-binding protein [Colwellia sp. BRX10-3]